ncbi:right-handed parallel beta-helix repeat-containing protein [Undibacterium sp. SXout11W]|uniref:right-handed parallel beta-helix repeat-containing protein n=1 Tax=Undibacterium sp. SXout11W TaxID=3413050 RepID=UPI003BF38192
MKNSHRRFVLLWSLANTTLAQECIPIEKWKNSQSMISAQKITQAGQYCLTHDFTAPRFYIFAEGGEKTAHEPEILKIQASNVFIDLHGFTLYADNMGMGGVSSGYWKDTIANQNITIRNGTLKSRTRQGIDFNRPNGSIFTDFYYSVGGVTKEELLESQKNNLRETLGILPKSADAYQKTEHLVERMKIESKLVGIGMKGASNIIRNSTIEITNGHAAIYLFGPNQLIENNIIIFKGKAAVESAAAIKLHQADGTIIRNNDIIIESKWDDAPKAAISLIDSKDVVIENNRIYGIDILVKNWDEKSSSIEKNNEFRSMFRRPLAIGEPGVH